MERHFLPPLFCPFPFSPKKICPKRKTICAQVGQWPQQNAPRLQNSELLRHTTHFPQEERQRGKEREKQSAKCWLPPFPRPPTHRAPTLWNPHPSFLTPTLSTRKKEKQIRKQRCTTNQKTKNKGPGAAKKKSSPSCLSVLGVERRGGGGGGRVQITKTPNPMLFCFVSFCIVWFHVVSFCFMFKFIHSFFTEKMFFMSFEFSQNVCRIFPKYVHCFCVFMCFPNF